VDAFGNITSPPYQSTQSQQAAHLSVEGGFFEEGTIAGQDIFRGYVLQYTDLIVPAGATLDLSLTCEISWVEYYGGCQLLQLAKGVNCRPSACSSTPSPRRRPPSSLAGR
jgi:hypothetical protein